MSIVGPRPFLTTHYEGYDKLDAKRRKRLRVRPGITGFSQAYFRNSISQEEKIRQDCYYVDHVSLAFDIKILRKTAQSVLLRENVFESENRKRK